MYNSIPSFIKDFEHETKSTTKYFSNITDDKLEIVYHENVRTIGWLSWHMVVAIAEMLNKAGLAVNGPVEYENQPATIAEMIEVYNTACTSAVTEITTKWTDATLEEEVNMYGQMWKKGMVLSTVLFHQTHHRGQLSVIMRLADLVVPGVIGPAKEEWAAWNMPAMK